MRLNDILDLEKSPKAVGTEPLRCSAMEIAKKVTAGKEKPKVWIKDWVQSKNFVLATVSLHKVGNPQPFQKRELIKTLSAGAVETEPVVLDINKKKLARTRTGYHPAVVLLAGNMHHSIASIQGVKYVKAWVGEEALKHLSDLSKTEGLQYYDGIAAQAPDLMRVVEYEKWPASQMEHAEFRQYGATGSELRNPETMNRSQMINVLVDYLKDVKDGNFVPTADMHSSVPSGTETLLATLKGFGIQRPNPIAYWMRNKRKI